MRQSGDRFQQPASVEDLRGFDKKSNTAPSVDGAPLAKYGDVWKVAPGSVSFFEAKAITDITAMRGVVIADGGVEHRLNLGTTGTDGRGFVGIAASNTITDKHVTVLQVCDIAPDKHSLDGDKTVYMDAKGTLTTVLKDSEKTAVGYTGTNRVLHLRMSGAGGGGVALEVMAAGLSKGAANILDFSNAAVSVVDGKATITTQGGGGGEGAGTSGPAAMVNFDGITYPDVIVRSSHNVSSVKRINGEAGRYEINFASAFPTENYYAVCSFNRFGGTATSDGFAMTINIIEREKGRMVVLCQYLDGAQYDFEYVSIVVLTGPVMSVGGEVTVAASGVVKGPVTQINFANSDVSYTGKVATITTRPNAVDPAPGDGVASLPIGYVSYQPWTGEVVTNGGDIWLRMSAGKKVDFGLYPELNKSPNVFDIVSDVPIMTSPSKGGFTISASTTSGGLTGGNPPFGAFDGTLVPNGNNDFWACARYTVNTTTGLTNQWIQVVKTTPFRIYGYGIAGYKQSGVPKEWELLASDNGATWDVLDKQVADETLVNLHYSNVIFNFPVQTIKAYRYYRIRVTKTAEAYRYDHFLITEILLWGDNVRFRPIPTDANGWFPYIKAKNGTLAGGGGGGEAATELEVFSKGVSQGVVDKLDFLTADIEVVEKKAAISEASSLGDGTLTVVPVGFTSPQPWTASVVANDTETWVRLDGSPVDPKEYPEISGNRNIIAPISVVPIMKSATQDGFTITQRSMHTATYAGWKAFNGLSDQVANAYLTSNTSLNTAGDVITEEWIQISRTEPFKVTGYGMVPINAYNPPTAWVFEGSNDGLIWETLDAQGGIDLTLVKQAYYTFHAEAEYRHYRIFFISAKLTISTKYLGLAELILCGASFVLADLGKDENDFYYYAKAKSSGSTGPAPDPTASTVVVAEAGIAKGPAATINFNGANIDVSDKQANVNFVISSQGGNGYPVGFTGYYPWTARVIISDAGVWLRQDGGLIDLAQYPQLKDSLNILELGTEVPPMTADTTGVWTAKASSVYSNAYLAYKAFDDNDYPINSWVSAIGTRNITTGKVPNSWIQISKNAAFTIHGYGFTCNPHQEYDPIKSWKFMGSTNGSSWVTLDTHLEHAYPIHYTLQNFALASSATYRFYRLQILDTVPGGTEDYTAVNRLHLWGANVRIKAVPKDSKGYFQYVKVQAGPYEAGGTTPAADIYVYEKGALKGIINKINFASSTVEVTDKTAVITNDSGSGGVSGGGGMPCGFVAQQPWDGMVHTDESGTWLNMSAGGQETSFATYPGLAAGAAMLYINSCVPNLTANTSGVWTASASSTSTTNPAWMAFGIDSGGWHSAANTVNATTGVCNQWVQITKTTPFKIYGYYFSGQGSGHYNGIWSWSFLGSVDGAKWDVLDTHTKYEPCVHDRRMYFAIDTPILYKAYRLNITSMKPNTLGNDSGNQTLCSIVNLALYDAPVSLPGYDLGTLGWPLFVKAAHPQGGG